MISENHAVLLGKVLNVPANVGAKHELFDPGAPVYNAREGRRMRFCESCGVGLGIMHRKTFMSKYKPGLTPCPYCGNDVRKIDPQGTGNKET